MKRDLLIAFSALILLGLLGLFLFFNARSGPFLFSGSSEEVDLRIAELQAQGEEVIHIIEQFRQEHGRWPRSCIEANVDPSLLETPYGPFIYNCEGEALGYRFFVGDYYDHGFRMWWDYEERVWDIDS